MAVLVVLVLEGSTRREDKDENEDEPDYYDAIISSEVLRRPAISR